MSRPRPSMYPSISNTRSSTALYPGFTTGIDLRHEMKRIMDEYGSWIMVRHFDRTKHSRFWNPETHESVGGPPWDWTDYVVRYREVIESTGLEMTSPVGLMTIPYAKVYVEWNIADELVANVDEMYKFTWTSDRTPTPVEAVDVCTVKLNITNAVDLLGDSGRREYYLCLCKIEVVGW